MKKFFDEFKTFITRGNVLDMSVGVIVGGAFTAIVTALTDNILRPLINWIISLFLGDSAATVYTVLKGVYDGEGNLLLDSSIYIDWGAFIGAIVNFLLIAVILFLIVKAINRVAQAGETVRAGMNAERRQKVAAYRGQGLSRKEAQARAEEDIRKAEEARAAEEKQRAEEAARAAEEKATANTRLLEEIRDLRKDR